MRQLQKYFTLKVQPKPDNKRPVQNIERIANSREGITLESMTEETKQVYTGNGYYTPQPTPTFILRVDGQYKKSAIIERLQKNYFTAHEI